MTAAKNWSVSYLDASFYHDSSDTSLLHYAPRLNWGEFSSRSIGNSITTVHCEIDLGYTADTLGDFQRKFPNHRLAPLIAEDVINTLSLRDGVEEPHQSKITLINTVPFPKIVLNVTVKHSDPNYKALLGKLKDDWEHKRIFQGDVVLTYPMVLVRSSYSVEVKYKEIAEKLNGIIGTDELFSARAEDAVFEFFESNHHQYCKTLSPDKSSPQLEFVKEFLRNKIIAGVFLEGIKVHRFDSGEEVFAKKNSRKLITT
ncbi:hypothetical protein HJ130_07255 [Vibrio parahaemolyticus]|nr:hypothetical protein [Vibrio parahaemolyticus]